VLVVIILLLNELVALVYNLLRTPFIGRSDVRRDRSLVRLGV
jgi:hypothetical protein